MELSGKFAPMTADEMRSRAETFRNHNDLSGSESRLLAAVYDIGAGIIDALVDVSHALVGEELDPTDPLCVHCGKNKRMHFPPWDHCPPPGVSPGTLFKEKEQHHAESRTQEQSAQEEAEEKRKKKRREIVIGCTNCDRPWSEHTGGPDGAVCPAVEKIVSFDTITDEVCSNCGVCVDFGLDGHEWRHYVSRHMDGKVHIVSIFTCNRGVNNNESKTGRQRHTERSQDG